ncbi:hypothetical protein QYE76_063263 [Lolium multiflorum]|uniref:SHSP domain-containing protein n=1 Tax=Lolium multiflorum TaxID=4521 RepID=A0AAD8W5P8_LOLMU|nr:hypothetical protein QYE76_017745 [Lolium multiflorum]KAK1641852.1 hypothetical protein QYE76_059657 [Lolium multiflorum]KAK1645458.1 hypothetical protein QYE76_063263 [Lolium multiflorum]
MQAAAAPAQARPPASRHRVYTAVDPRCVWARTADTDTLVVDVSGFRKEELKVLYNTSRKLKVTGERPVAGGARARWARFLKSFPVPRSVDTGGIKAVMDKDKAVLYVILPKGSPSSSTDRQKHKEQQQQPGSSLPLPNGEQKAGTGNADSSSGSGTGGSFRSAQEDAEKNRTEENNVVPEEIKVTIQEEEIAATQDGPRTNARADANAVEKDDEDDDEEDGNKRWWQKIRPLHVLGFVVLILALVGIGALCVLL